MINTQYINLNMSPSGVMPVLYMSQYDIGRPLGMVVYNGGESVDLDAYTCTIEATRTDGTAITAAVTTDGNVGAFVTTATMTNQNDKYPAKLVLFDSNSRRVASIAFIMCVTPKTMDENAESIQEDASLYQQYTETVQALIADIHEDIGTLENTTAALEETTMQLTGSKTALMCVSTYRDSTRDDIYEYYLALSYDSGVTWKQIDASKNFANLPIGSDVQVYPYDDGFLFLATGSSYSDNRDFYAVYTKDFETYTQLTANLGFIAKSYDYIGANAYVWSPNIAEINGDYYITCGVGYAATESTNVYGETTSGGTRYLKPFCIKVNIDLSNCTITADGSMFELDFANDTTSIMDISIRAYGGYIYAIYKDRIYNVVNIAKASAITGTFTDVVQVVGNIAFNEAGYLLEIDGTLNAFWTNYNPWPYNQKGILVNDTVQNEQYIGCINPSHYYEGSLKNVGMRNPYPCVVGGETLNRLYALYGTEVSTNLPEYRIYAGNKVLTNTVWRRSQVLYNKYTCRTRINQDLFYGISDVSGISDAYIANEDFLVEASNNTVITIHTPYRDCVLYNADLKRKDLYVVRGQATLLYQSNILTEDYTLSNGWKLRARRTDNTIWYYFYDLSTSATSDNEALGTITNTNLRPESLIGVLAFTPTVGTIGAIEINSNGSISYHGASIASGVRAKYTAMYALS